MVLTLDMISRLGRSRFRSIEYVLMLSDCQFNFAETLHLYRVQTALKLSNKGRPSSVVSLTVRYVIKCLR